jgi:hypothetical protein
LGGLLEALFPMRAGSLRSPVMRLLAAERTNMICSVAAAADQHRELWN